MSSYHYFCKGGSFDYGDLDIQWESNSYDGEDVEIEFKAYARGPKDVSWSLSDIEVTKILDKCWDEYWRAHA